MEDNLKTYINFSSIHLKQVKKLKKVKLPIYKDKKLSYKRYKRISKKCFLEETNKNYIAYLEIGIIKELKNQEIIMQEEMVEIVRHIKKKYKLLEVDF